MLSPYSTNDYDPDNVNTTWHKMIGMVPENSTVLDVGCSSGKLGAVLKSTKQATVIGIDITAADIEVAKNNLDNAFVFDVENESMEDVRFAAYDCIIFADVLEHMKNPVKVLKEIKKLLRPGGILIFSIPNMAHMFVRLQLMEGKFQYTETGLLDNTHLHFYDETEVARIFHDSEYAVKEYDCTTFDYPDELLEEKLKKIGLKPTEKFFKTAHSKQAVIFEYVGWAQPVKTTGRPEKSVGIGTTSPLDDVLGFVQRNKDADKSIIKQLNDKVAASDLHVQKMEANILGLEQDNKVLQEKLSHFESHPLRQVVKKYIRKD